MSLWEREPDVRLPRGLVVLAVVLGIAIVGAVVFTRSLVGKTPPIPQRRVAATLRGTGLTVVPATTSSEGATTAYGLTRAGAPLPVKVTVFDTLVRARQAALAAVNARTFRVRNVLLVESRDISRQDEPIVLAAMNRLGQTVSP